MTTDDGIGLTGLAIYLPEERMTSGDVAKRTGLPEWVVREKLGIYEKVVPGPDDHPHEMAVKAAHQVLQESHIAPDAVDLVISMTEEYKDYPMMTTGIALAGDLGLRRAWAFDVAQRCGTGVLALRMAKNFIQSDNQINTVLVAGGYQNVDLIDYSNPRVRFMYNLGAGAAAMVIQRQVHGHQILGSAFVTDGDFSRDVLSPRGGTKAPLGDMIRPYLDVRDATGMKERLEARSMQNFLRVVRAALAQSQLTVEHIGYLSLLHMKRSAHQAILRALDLSEEQSIYLDHYGHLGQVDQVLSTVLALQEHRIKSGDYVVWVSAGIGYAWDAAVIRWGEVEDDGGTGRLGIRS